MSGAAKVIMSEVDLSTRVPSFPGVYGYIGVAARRGKVGVPTLVTGETQYLGRYTVSGESVDVGDDMAHYSALAYLQGSDKLWVHRLATGSKYGGLKIVSGATALVALANGLEDPAGIVFDGADLCMLTGKDQGAWNGQVSIKLTANLVEANAFNIQVYFKGVLQATYAVTRVEGQKDGFGRSMFIEDVLAASPWISGYNNPLVEGTTLPTIPLATAAAVALAGGGDGTAVLDGARILALDNMKNTNSYPLTVILDGGQTTVPHQKAMISVAETRRDCVAILSTDYAAEANADYMTEVIKYRKETLNANTTYAALYSPHLKLYDKFNDRYLWVAPDGFVGAIISRTAGNQEIWYPMAGWRRGIVPLVEDVLVRYTDGEMDLLYDNQINPIRFKAGRGIAVWGQKTLTSRPSRLDRLNVRLLLIVIEPAIAEALEDYIFEINDVTQRAIVTAMIESYMEGIKGRNGVSDFMVMCNDENNSAEDIDNYTMNVWLFVKPSASAEYIKFKTVITPTGMDFSLAADAV